MCDWGGTNLFSVPVVCNDDASISDFDFETLVSLLRLFCV